MSPGDIQKEVSGRDGRANSSRCKTRPATYELQGAQILGWGETGGEGGERRGLSCHPSI